MTPYMNQALNPREVEAYIRQASIKRRIDPATALRVWGSEGRSGYIGDKGSSFGPFQLHYGGVAPGGNRVPGFGDEFTKKTGLDARDPSTWKQQIDFSLDHAAKSGWGPWHGAAKIGLSNKAGIPALVGAPTPITEEQPPTPMNAAMVSPTQETTSGGFDGMNSFGNALLGVSGALQNINNPGAGNSLLKMAMENSSQAPLQFRGFMPNGKGMLFTDSRGNEQIRPVPEAYQGPKENDAPSEIRTIEILAQRPDLMKLWKERHSEGEDSGPALTPEGLDSATELYVSSGGKMGMVGLNKADKTAITNNIAKWAEAHGKTLSDIIANGPKMAGYMSQEREMGRASTRMQTAKAEMDSTLKTLEERAAKLPPELVNGSVPWNMFMQKSAELWNKEGRPELAAYRETIQNAANAYATILARGAAVVPVSMQNRASELFNTYMSPDTIKSVTGTMRDTADRMMQSMKYSQENIRAEIAGRPLPHQNVEQDIEKFLTEKRGTTPAASGGIPTVSDKAAFDALPSGAEFIGPDGKKRRKN